MPAYKRVPKEEPKVIAITDVHPKVDLKDLRPNGKLFSKEELEALNHTYLSQGRTRINELRRNPGLENVNFSVSKIGNKLYAVYSGEKKGKHLGKGSFGVGRLAQDLETGEWVFLKSIKKIPELRGKTEAEVKRLEKTGALIGSYARGDRDEVLMRLATGPNLLEFKRSNRKMSPVRWIDMQIAILKSIKELHQKGILHCDIKPENIIYDPITREVKIIDLGNSVEVDSIQRGVIFNRAVGTPLYMASEAFIGTNNEKTEVYAAGITIAEMLHMTEFREDDHTYKVIRDKKNMPIPDDEDYILSILLMMTDDDNVHMRPTIDEAIGHFERMRENYLNAEGLLTKVAYFDIAEYLASTDAEKEMIRSALKEADEVFLVDKNGVHEENYIQLKKELENQGIIVMKEVVQYDNKLSADKAIKEHMAYREKNEEYVFGCKSVQAKGKVFDIPAAYPKEQADKIIASLNQEIARLNAKIALNIQVDDARLRIEKIKTGIDRITAAKNQGADFKMLVSELNILQENLKAKKGTFARQLEDYTRYKATTSRENIIKLADETKKAEAKTAVIRDKKSKIVRTIEVIKKPPEKKAKAPSVQRRRGR